MLWQRIITTIDVRVVRLARLRCGNGLWCIARRTAAGVDPTWTVRGRGSSVTPVASPSWYGSIVQPFFSFSLATSASYMGTLPRSNNPPSIFIEYTFTRLARLPRNFRRFMFFLYLKSLTTFLKLHPLQHLLISYHLIILVPFIIKTTSTTAHN